MSCETPLTLRLVLELRGKIERIDLSLYEAQHWEPTLDRLPHRLVYEKAISQKPAITPAASYTLAHEPQLQTWFLFFECIKKFMRRDHLIGLHLLLDLIRQYLVLRMHARDQCLGTRIHRTGGAERLPELLELTQLYYQNPQTLLDYLSSLAIEMDKVYQQRLANYQSSLPYLLQHIMDSRTAIPPLPSGLSSLKIRVRGSGFWGRSRCKI